MEPLFAPCTFCHFVFGGVVWHSAFAVDTDFDKLVVVTSSRQMGTYSSVHTVTLAKDDL